MRRLPAALVLLAALHGCRDFDDALTRCAVNRICTDGTVSNNYTLALSPSEVAVSGIGTATTKLAITMPNSFFGSLELRVDGARDAGLYATFQPQPIYFYDTAATLSIRAAGVPTAMQTWTLDVVAAAPDGGIERMRESVKLSVGPPKVTTLLVDDDESENNLNADTPAAPVVPSAEPSPLDLFYAAGLTARNVPFDTWAHPFTFTGTGALTLEHLRPYTRIVWYTTSSYTDTSNVTPADDAALRAWLDLGGRTLVLVSEAYVGSQSPDAWDILRPGKTLVADYIGALGGDDSPEDDGVAYEFLGVAGQTTAGQALRVLRNDTYVSVVNVKPGTQALFTVRANPDSMGARQLPAATVRRTVGTSGTSTVAYVGFSIFYVKETATGSRSDALKAVLDAAGL